MTFLCFVQFFTSLFFLFFCLSLSSPGAQMDTQTLSVCGDWDCALEQNKGILLLYNSLDPYQQHNVHSICCVTPPSSPASTPRPQPILQRPSSLLWMLRSRCDHNKQSPIYILYTIYSHRHTQLDGGVTLHPLHNTAGSQPGARLTRIHSVC